MMREPSIDQPRKLRWILVLLFLIPFRCIAQTDSEYARGLAAFRAGDYASAADLFAKAETASPGTTDALIYRAKSLVHLRDFSSSESALRRYIALHADSDEALYLLGFVLHRENKASESLEVYTKAAALKTPTGEDLKIVGLDYVLLNDYANAIKWLEKAVQLDPKNKDAWYYLGRAYYTRGLLPESRRAFLTVLDLDPRDARAENNLGLILESGAKPNEALEAYRKAMEWQAGSEHRSEQPYLNFGNLSVREAPKPSTCWYLMESPTSMVRAGMREEANCSGGFSWSDSCESSEDSTTLMRRELLTLANVGLSNGISCRGGVAEECKSQRDAET